MVALIPVLDFTQLLAVSRAVVLECWVKQDAISEKEKVLQAFRSLSRS